MENEELERKKDEAFNAVKLTPVDSLVIGRPVHFTRSMFPVGSFTFMQDNISATLNIQPDITPLESAHLCVLLAQAAAAAVTSISSFAWLDYINAKNLHRHFEIKNCR